MSSTSCLDETSSADSYERLHQIVTSLIERYAQAWTMQDTDMIVSVFTPDATYHERVLAKPMRGHDEIRNYWNTKVCREQANIQFALRQLYIDTSKSTAIAEWEASFDDIPGNCRKHMLEIAVLDIQGEKISGLREYWCSEKLCSL
jgi:ketosteroid isomerase-like protein